MDNGYVFGSLWNRSELLTPGSTIKHNYPTQHGVIPYSCHKKDPISGSEKLLIDKNQAMFDCQPDQPDQIVDV